MKNQETEQILLNDENYENFIKNKTEAEFNDVLNKDLKQKTKLITDITLVPHDKLFSKRAIFTVINKTSKTQSYINGIQAEGFIDSNIIREKLLNGTTDYFVNEDNYIKFYGAELCVNS